MLTLPALWNWWANKDEEWYRNLPRRERYLYLKRTPAPKCIRSAAPDWASAFVTTPVALLDSWYLQDPASAREALKHIFSVTQPLDYPVLLGAAKEQWQNRIDFFDRPIIPRGELDLLPGQQRSEYTSQLAKELGDLFPGNISPRRVDAALRQVFGGVGGDRHGPGHVYAPARSQDAGAHARLGASGRAGARSAGPPRWQIQRPVAAVARPLG